jgi:hypothetical protein
MCHFWSMSKKRRWIDALSLRMLWGSVGDSRLREDQIG